MDHRSAEQVVLAHGWLAGAPHSVQAALLAQARPVTFAAGAVVFRGGDEAGGIYGIASGAIGILVATEGRSPRLAHIARRGVWFGHGPLMTGGRRSLGFRAIEPSFVLHVALAALSKLSRDSNEAAQSLGLLATGNTSAAIAAVSDLLIGRVDRRVAATLLRVTGALQGVPPSDPAGYRLTQADLAEMSNASRQMVNRCLAGFAARGWISRGYQRIAILAPAALATFAAEVGDL